MTRLRLRVKRFAYGMTEVLDYRTLVVATVFLVLALVGYIVVGSLQQAHDASAAAKSATDAANKRSAAASRRIDLLNQQIRDLQAQIAAGRDERGQLAAAVAALAEQVRQAGGRPVITVPPGSTVTVRPSPTPRRTASPSPRPTVTRTPSPKPSPTCTRLLGLLC